MLLCVNFEFGHWKVFKVQAEGCLRNFTNSKCETIYISNSVHDASPKIDAIPTVQTSKETVRNLENSFYQFEKEEVK